MAISGVEFYSRDFLKVLHFVDEYKNSFLDQIQSPRSILERIRNVEHYFDINFSLCSDNYLKYRCVNSGSTYECGVNK